MDIQYEYRRHDLYDTRIAYSLVQKASAPDFYLAVACAICSNVYSRWNFKQIRYYDFTIQVHYKKISYFSIAAFSALIIAICYVLLTNAS